jgi:hypothetical protein
MLIDGSRDGTRHLQKTMDHFNAVVFKDTVAAEVCDKDDADSSEIDLGLNDLSIDDDDDPPLGRMQDPPTTDPEHSSNVHIHSQFDGVMGSLQAATPSRTTQFQCYALCYIFVPRVDLSQPLTLSVRPDRFTAVYRTHFGRCHYLDT